MVFDKLRLRPSQSNPASLPRAGTLAQRH